MKNISLKSNIVKYCFSFFTSFFAFCLVLIFAFGIISTPKYAKVILDKSDYINLSLDEIENTLSSIAIPGGFPKDFFEYGITDKTLKDNIYPFLDAVYKNQSYTADSSAFYNEALDRSMDYLRKNYPGYSEEIEKNVVTMVELCVKEYMVYTTPRSMRYLGNYISKITPMVKYGIVIFGVFLIISITVLCKYRAEKKFYIISLLSASLLMLTLPLCLKLFGELENVAITSKALYCFVLLFVNTFLNFFIYLGSFLLIVTAVLCIILCFKGIKQR